MDMSQAGEAQGDAPISQQWAARSSVSLSRGPILAVAIQLPWTVFV